MRFFKPYPILLHRPGQKMTNAVIGIITKQLSPYQSAAIPAPGKEMRVGYSFSLDQRISNVKTHCEFRHD
jgi:hypothetical protein